MLDRRLPDRRADELGGERGAGRGSVQAAAQLGVTTEAATSTTLAGMASTQPTSCPNDHQATQRREEPGVYHREAAPGSRLARSGLARTSVLAEDVVIPAKIVGSRAGHADAQRRPDGVRGQSRPGRRGLHRRDGRRRPPRWLPLVRRGVLKKLHLTGGRGVYGAP